MKPIQHINFIKGNTEDKGLGSLGVTAKILHGSTSKPRFKLFARNMKEISLLGSGVMILT